MEDVSEIVETEEVENELHEEEGGEEEIAGEEPEDKEPSQEDELDEWEHDGKAYKVPKALKPNLMMQADYTRKTQELAEQRKAFHSEKEAYAQASQEHLRDISKVFALDDQIEQYKRLDWNALTQQDPVQAQQLFIQFSTLKDQREALAQQVEIRESERRQKQSTAMSEKLAAGLEELQRDIPGWGKDVADAISNFAISGLGFDQKEVANITDTKTVKALYRHMRMEEENKKLRAEIAKLTKPQPAKKVGGGTSPNMTKKLSDPNLSDDEWLALRRSQLKRK